MTQSDYSHAEAELTGSPWLAHLAGGSAAAATVLAWALLVLVAPGYLVPYSEQAIQLSIPAQIVLQGAISFRGALGFGVLLITLGISFGLWQKARNKGGLSTVSLFAIAGLMSIVAIFVVIACASPLHLVQDLPPPR